MDRFWKFIDTMRMEIWLAAIFLFHLFLYLALRTPNGVLIALLATAFYAVLLSMLKVVARRRRQQI